jgi:hypothetical protein
MLRLFKDIDAWRIRRQQRSLERWALVRAKGRARYVFHQGLTWAVFMIAVTDVSDQLFESGVELSRLRLRIICYSLSGILMGFIAWSNQEGKYERACRSRRSNTV